MSDPLIKIEGLSVTFPGEAGRLRAVDDVSLMMCPGEALGLVGESGSGKSTVGLASLGLLPRAAEVSGSIRIGGMEIVGARQKDLRHVRGRQAAMVFQNPMVSLSPFRTIGGQLTEIISECRSLAPREARAEALKGLERVQLPEPGVQLNKFPHQLSGGQLQRVLIAAATVCGASFLVADEPTTALDVTIQAEILSLLKELRTSMGLSLLFVSHNLAVVADLCERVAVMKSGKIVEEGPCEKILTKPDHPYTKQLISSVPRFGASQRRGRSALPQKPFLKVDALSVRFRTSRGAFQALKDVSFDIPEGGSLGLVGESGSGKSTIALCLLGLVRASRGEASLGGHDLLSAGWRRRRQIAQRIGIVFQNPYGSLNPRMRIERIVGEPLMVHRGIRGQELRERVTALLEQVGLDASFAARLPVALSGGQRQRVAIARTLALEPDLLVLDEPTAALDVTVQARIIDVLQELREARGLTYLFISHDLAVVETIADEVVVLRHGCVVEKGPVGDVFYHPQTDYTRKLVEAVPLLPPGRKL